MPAALPTEKKRATRDAILRQAAKAIRARGPAGVGVAEIMRAAGLTHGGFYAHFGSKDDLVAAAITRMFEEGRERFARRVGDATGLAALRIWIDSYLAPEHRDRRGSGCAVSVMSGDTARLDRAARAAFDAGIEGIIVRYMQYLPQARKGYEPRVFAQAMIAQLAGAVALARATVDPALSDSILEAVKRNLHAQLDALEKVH